MTTDLMIIKALQEKMEPEALSKVTMTKSKIGDGADNAVDRQTKFKQLIEVSYLSGMDK